MLLLTALLLAAPAPPADYAAIEKALKAALPEGWKLVSGGPAEFTGPGEELCWLATLEVKKAGDYDLVVKTEHDPAHYYLRHTRSTCTYALSIGAAGTKRSVADGRALPQCNVGDELVVPIPVTRGDKNHRFTLAPAAKGSRAHVFGHKRRMSVTEAAAEATPFKVDNKAARHLKFISGTHLHPLDLDEPGRHRPGAVEARPLGHPGGGVCWQVADPPPQRDHEGRRQGHRLGDPVETGRRRRGDPEASEHQRVRRPAEAGAARRRPRRTRVRRRPGQIEG